MYTQLVLIHIYKHRVEITSNNNHVGHVWQQNHAQTMRKPCTTFCSSSLCTFSRAWAARPKPKTFQHFEMGLATVQHFGRPCHQALQTVQHFWSHTWPNPVLSKTSSFRATPLDGTNVQPCALRAVRTKRNLRHSIVARDTTVSTLLIKVSRICHLSRKWSSSQDSPSGDHPRIRENF